MRAKKTHEEVMPEAEALDDKIEEAVMDGQIADEVLEGGEGEADIDSYPVIRREGFKRM